jgi:hypothetical protein
MPDVSLKLEALKLSCPEERIKLLVTSSATFRPQDDRFRRVRSDELLHMMESGKTCISRGPSCDLGFGFSFKNLQSNGPAEKALVEQLRRFVLGAPVSSACIVTLIFVSVSLKSSIVVGTTPSFSFSQFFFSHMP